MSLLRFNTVDVFTDEGYAGNPLAVVMGGADLSGAQMQRIAREFNLSETVFVLPSTRPDAALRLRIFTPLEELPFAGHPTIGAACLLASKGLVPRGNEVCFTLEEGVGPVAVRVKHLPGDLPYAELTAAQEPQFSPAAAAGAIAETMGLSEDAVGAGGPIVANCGLPMLLVPLRAPELLAGVDTDFNRLPGLLKSCAAHSVYVYAQGYEGELRARMFSPGIGEDPATGSAALALAARLAADSAEAEIALSWTVHQGEEMGRPSRLFISADKSAGRVSALRVGGYTVSVMEGHLNAP